MGYFFTNKGVGPVAIPARCKSSADSAPFLISLVTPETLCKILKGVVKRNTSVDATAGIIISPVSATSGRAGSIPVAGTLLFFKNACMAESSFFCLLPFHNFFESCRRKVILRSYR